jgi:hypothetical protein
MSQQGQLARLPSSAIMIPQHVNWLIVSSLPNISANIANRSQEWSFPFRHVPNNFFLGAARFFLLKSPCSKPKKLGLRGWEMLKGVRHIFWGILAEPSKDKV